jgi:hypothetical protein
MATKAQFDFFNGMYAEQTDRRKNIQDRAKFYFTIVSFYFGVILFKIPDVADPSKLSKTERWFSIASAVFLSASLIFTLLATRVRSFEIPCDPEKVLESYGDKLPEEAEFLEDRIVDLVVAINRNRKENAKSAKQISLAGWLMFAAIGIQLLGLIWLSFFFRHH